MTYASAFRSAGIGTTYVGAFKSVGTGSKNVGIDYIHIFIKVVPTQVKKPEQGLKASGPIPTFKKKKNAEIGILTLSQRFLGLSQQF